MFKEVFPNVFAFISKDAGSNCFVLKGTKKIALVDSSSFFNKKQLLAGLAKLSISKADRLLILHTHGHADHIGCDEFFPNAKVAMHKNDAKMINEKNEEFACTSFFPGTALPLVSTMLKGGQKINLGGISLEVVQTPGHTTGSICFLLKKEKALLSGDCLFADGFGRTDLPGGNSKKMVESLKKLQKMPLKALLPGHGPILLGDQQIAEHIRISIELASTNAFL